MGALMDEDKAIVTSSYLEALEEANEFLDCLLEAGVASWDGYDVAIEMLDDRG